MQHGQPATFQIVQPADDRRPIHSQHGQQVPQVIAIDQVQYAPQCPAKPSLFRRRFAV